ncbi:T9SS-dependent choice-of-anchor J family protein [Chryseobacterium sp.]|uniref:T9SS-dependent choice-of-anchor J family protein n=1 Tax=Chryseobacterium sp. TaxID=1871047 RepID=UPI002FC86667
MKKILLLGAFLGLSSLNAQTTIFEDSFDTYTDFAINGVGNWTLTDVDLKTTYGFQGVTFLNSGAAKSFQVFNSTATTPALTPTATSNWTARTGSKMMVCFAAGSSPWNNDWMISPKVQLGSSGNVLTFWAKSCDSTFGAEKFKVLVSTTTTATASFTTVISPNPVTTPADATWHQYTYNLDAFNGQNVHIAIQCISQDQFGFGVDDFKVTTTGTLATSEVSKTSASAISVYPNPTTDVLNINSKEKVNNIEIYDISGRKVPAELNGDKVNVRNLNPGSYIINIETKAGKTTDKFIKK